MTRPLKGFTDRRRVEARQTEPPPDHPCPLCPADVPIESLRLRFALLQSLNTTLETFFLPLVELRQTPMYTHSIAALLKEAKGQCLAASSLSPPHPPRRDCTMQRGQPRSDWGGGSRPPRPSLSPTFLPPGLIFYDTKVTVMNRVLNATVQRTADHAAPEITLDPLEIVGGEMSHANQKMQAAAPG